MSSAFQTTQYSIKGLLLILPNGERIDISEIFDELSLFDSILAPCVSGNILINDANNIAEKLKFDGYDLTKLYLLIDKGLDLDGEPLIYEKEYVIYKMSQKENFNFTSQRYVLHFVAEEYTLSLQKKINQHFHAPYHEVVKIILQDYLKIPPGKPKNGKAGIGIIEESVSGFLFDMPTLTPFESLNWITKRALSIKTNNPDFLCYETQRDGYQFRSLKSLMDQEPVFRINFNPKNIFINDFNSEFLGARDLKILGQYDVAKNVQDGSYRGQKLLFDPLTRTFQYLQEENIYDTSIKDGTKANLPDDYNKERKLYKDMEDSRIVAYPYQMPRRDPQNGTGENYFLDNVFGRIPEAPFFPKTADIMEQYIYRRKPIFTNLMQRRLQLVMPGNFGLYSGMINEVFVPKYSIKQEDNKTYDDTLSGNYIVIAARHILRYDKHETIIQVANDKLEF